MTVGIIIITVLNKIPSEHCKNILNMAGSALKARGAGRPIPLFRLFSIFIWKKCFDPNKCPSPPRPVEGVELIKVPWRLFG